MGGVVRVIEINGPTGFAGAGLNHAGIAIEIGEVGTADRAILIQQEA